MAEVTTLFQKLYAKQGLCLFYTPDIKGEMKSAGARSARRSEERAYSSLWGDRGSGAAVPHMGLGRFGYSAYRHS